MFLVIKTGFNFPQTFADSGFKKELMETALLLNELCSCLSESVRTGMLSWCACAETHFADVSESVAAISWWQAGAGTWDDWASDLRDQVQKRFLKCSELRIRGYVRTEKNVMCVIKIQLVWIRGDGFPKNSHVQNTMP